MAQYVDPPGIARGDIVLDGEGIFCEVERGDLVRWRGEIV